MNLVVQALPFLLALGVGGAIGVLAARCRDWRWRPPAARTRLQSMPHPAMLASFAGDVQEMNGGMAQLAGDAPGRVEAVLARCLEHSSARVVYRLSQSARDLGFAYCPAVLSASGDPKYLTVWAGLNNELIWSLIPTGRMVEPVPALLASPFETAPFAHMRREGSGRAVVNATFTRFFGRDPGPVLATLPDDADAEGDRVLLTCRDGQVRLFRVFLESEPGGEQDLFLFPVSGAGFKRSGPTRILEMVPVPLAQFETDGTLLWASSRAREMLGLRAEAGTRFSSIFVSPTQSGTALDPARLVEEQARTGRSHMLQLSDTDIFVQIALAQVSLYERETLIAVLTDASQIRQLEDQFAQSQKMEAVGKLAGGVAHDFNNVLTAIVGHCDLLLLGKDANHPDYADLMQITQNANRAAALVRQLLAFSRKQTLNPEVLSIQDVVSETHYLLNRLVGETVSLLLEVGTDIWPVRADQQQLEQVLMNLVVNARDAMDGSGTVTITLANRPALSVGPGDSLGSVAPREDYVEIRLIDTGPGIPPGVIDKVFDPFFTTKAKGEGTGLGLSTVYGIVKQSGGHIFAENRPEGGACFRILIPRATDVAPEPPKPVRERRDLTGRGSILLVEDEHPVRAFAARALKLRGYEVAEAATAEDAMQILADPDYEVHLLVSDVVMPGMDGPTFAAEARRMRPDLRLLFVSGYAEESFRENLTATDFMFLAKPFSLNELTAKVKEALGAPSMPAAPD
ncbi:MAG: ATP-binding protein [Pikeienuella sp.]